VRRRPARVMAATPRLAGFKIPMRRFRRSGERFCAYASDCFPERRPQPSLVLDGEAPLHVLQPGAVGALENSSPGRKPPASCLLPPFTSRRRDALGTERHLMTSPSGGHIAAGHCLSTSANAWRK